MAVGLFLLCLTSLSAQVTVSPTLPDPSTFLWGNSSVNAPGQTSYVNGTGYGYRYLLPQNFDPTVKYPAIIFLHGDGESGTDNVLQLSVQNNTGNGVLALVSTANPNNQQNYPCFFICPQKPVGSIWSSDASATEIKNILNIFETQYPNAFDTTRIYITGLSDGGTGAYDMPFLLAQNHQLGANPFAAAVPMSASFGYYIDRPFSSQPFMPIWAFHAADDPNAPISGSDDTCVPALRALGFSILYTRYNTGGHVIWELAYQHPQLLPWLFSQQLGQAVQGPLSNFAVTTATQSSGPVLNLSGTADTSVLPFNGLSWSNSTNGQSGTASGSPSPTWSISDLPLSSGTNDIQVTASAPNNTALVLGNPADYGGTLTVNLPLNVSPSVNVALNQPVTVSSTVSATLGGANAVDGNPTTRWSSDYTDNEWIEVDLGANYNISEVDLNWESACGKNYQIQTSTDNVNWTTQSNIVGNTTSGLLKYAYATPVVGRYVRMLGTLRATVWGYSLFEFSVYSADPATTLSSLSSLPSLSSLYFQNGTSLAMLSVNTSFLPTAWQGVGTMGAGWQECAIADVNGDGTNDIIFQNGTLIGALIMNADGTPNSWVGIGQMNAGWQLCGAAAITGDGNLDLIFQNGTLLGYLEVSTAGVPLSWNGIGVMGDGWQLRAVACLDGTGQPDLIFQNGCSLGALQVGTNGQPTAWNGIGMMSSGWTLSYAVDLNGDDQPDLVFQNGTSLGALEVNTSFQPVAWHGLGAMDSGWTLPGDY